jgi:hypothetical protein
MNLNGLNLLIDAMRFKGLSNDENILQKKINVEKILTGK